jgi:hypothetical protein
MKTVAFGLTLEELWQLFPIELTEHNPAWRDWYKAEESSTAKRFDFRGCAMYHLMVG